MDGILFIVYQILLFLPSSYFFKNLFDTSQMMSIALADSSCLGMNSWNTISTYSPNVRAAPGAIIRTATAPSRIMASTGGC